MTPAERSPNGAIERASGGAFNWNPVGDLLSAEENHHLEKRDRNGAVLFSAKTALST